VKTLIPNEVMMNRLNVFPVTHHFSWIGIPLEYTGLQYTHQHHMDLTLCPVVVPGIDSL